MRSRSIVINFVMKSPAAENALSESMDVGGYCLQSINEKTFCPKEYCLYHLWLPKKNQFF